MKIIVVLSLLVGSADALMSSSSRRAFLNECASMGGAALTGTAALVTSRPAQAFDVGGNLVFGDESIMSNKAHGTSDQPVQAALQYGVPNKLADKICNFNRRYAESGGYFQSTDFEEKVLQAKAPITFYDSVTGKPLFQAPIGRSPQEFISESRQHGWPSFRDQEVVWENVRVLKSSGETVSVDGTHLGHDLPDRTGNRYCINLVSIAGQPMA
uniref:Peptide-methionine (R)-S-oxide reductase n=1 Tax=Grammatophora oceanica TaxID=210454 RepID=A0A7S1YBM0_9STRA|mmetsp:Transcript_40597/g.60200  ORF Transcript_40597/g.60200 Transcript_40597/m.60200 type:complete len:213 (+) Transcript_40597:193-831(+)